MSHVNLNLGSMSNFNNYHPIHFSNIKGHDYRAYMLELAKLSDSLIGDSVPSSIDLKLKSMARLHDFIEDNDPMADSFAGKWEAFLKEFPNFKEDTLKDI